MQRHIEKPYASKLPQLSQFRWGVPCCLGIVLMFFCIALPCLHGEAEVIVSPSSASADMQRADGCFIIREGGVYTISGSGESMQILVKTERSEVTTLILQDAAIACPDGAAIFGVSGKLDIQLEGDNSVRGGNGEQPAAIYCKDDITIGGEGRLHVEGSYRHGIESRDELRIYGGGLSVEAARDALRGRERLEIHGGSIDCRAGNDGLKANGDKEGELGCVTITGGDIALFAEDDGVHAEGAVRITGGTLTIAACLEGLEGREIHIGGGELNITATDDALNANGDESSLVSISGGRLLLWAQGDGIDSNGRLELSGGEITLHGSTSRQNSPFDYKGRCETRDTILYAAGSAAMMQAPISVDGRTTLRLYFDQYQHKETRVSVLDKEGAPLLRFTPQKDFQAVIIAHPALRALDEVQILLGKDGESDTRLCAIQLQEGITSINQHGEPCDYVSNSLGW